MRRAVLGCVLVAAILLASQARALLRGGGNLPSNSSIPVTSLATGNYSVNNWAGIASPAATIFTAGDGRKYIRQNPDSSAIIATGANWRDQEVTTYIASGTIQLRSVANGGLFFSVGVAAANAVRIGIISGGVQYNTLVEDNASGCITNWPPDGSHTFTFGIRGFNVYLKIDGAQAIDTCKTTAINPTGAIAYQEYRASAMLAGAPTVQPTGGNGARDITFTYFQQTFLYSAYAINQLDPRDFGMRSPGAVTGSMSAASPTLTLSAAADFRVGDQVIVEVGGESVAGYNTIGVGGVSPVLHYATGTTRDADHSQANGTYAYLDTDGSVWVYNSGSTTWAAADLGGPYYIGKKTALSLVAKVSAVNGSPATQLTLGTNSAVSTTNANVYLDSLPSLYPYTTPPGAMFVAGRYDGLDSYSNMTVTLPLGTWYFSGAAMAASGGSGTDRAGFTLAGQGISSTTLKSPKGVPSQLLDTGSGNSNVTVRDFTHVGNLGDSGYGFALSGANKNFNGYGTTMISGNFASNVVFNRVACVDPFGQCISLAGTNPQILNSSSTLSVGQRVYFGWQLQLSNCNGGQIADSTVTGAFLVKAFEFFACNGASINNTTGTNALYSTNSSSNWAITSPNDTITANSFFNQNSGWIDEAIINVNDNAFGSGNTGTISNPRLVQQGYIDASKNSLKFIQIATLQTDVTVQGQFPGGGGCSTVLGGFMQAPNYDAGSAEYGAMAVMSDAARTIVSGIRIKGTAVGPPGPSGHFGNISLLGASSQANNSVADVIQTGPTLSGNQTNAAYGGC